MNLKKKVWIIGMTWMLCGTTITYAQTFGEWFNQKKTQKKYLIEQIAALKMYGDYLEKGYSIAKNGLTLIGDIKNGEFSLHKEYFNSLGTVNPKIMHYSRVAAILSLQINLLAENAKIRTKINASNDFSSEEKTHIKSTVGIFIDEAANDLDELSLILDNGKMKMTDDERIKAIDRVYEKVLEKQTALREMDADIDRAARDRSQIKKENTELKDLYGKP